MKKIIIIWMFVFFILTSIVTADFWSDNNAISIYEFQDFLDSLNNFSISNQSKQTPLIQDKITDTGCINEKCWLNNNNGNNLVGNYLNGTQIDPDDYDSGLTISTWIYLHNISNCQNDQGYLDCNIYSWAESGAWGGYALVIDSDGEMGARFGNGVVSDGGSVTNIPASLSTGQWYHIASRHTATNNSVFVDGNLVWSGNNGNLANNAKKFAIGAFTGGGGVAPMNATFDEFYIFGSALTSENITVLSNNTFYNFFGNTMNISSPSIADGIQITQPNINFNITMNSSITGTNCSLTLNGTINETQTNLGAGANIDVIFTKNLVEGDWTYKISCFDGTTTKTTTTNSFLVDFSNPTITDNFKNNSLYFKNNITFQVNFSDNIILSSYNISIDGTSVQGQTSINNKNLSVNFNYNVSSLLEGLHNLTITIRDGHTAKELKEDYEFNNGLVNDYSKYDFYDGGWIKTKNKDSSVFDTWTSNKLKDRYTQTYTPSNPSTTLILIEESDTPIQIIKEPNGKYKGEWIVIGNHWKDYVLKNEPESKVKIKQITDYKVEVTISNIKNIKELEFQSVGDLNIVTKNYTFYKSNITSISPSNVLETQLKSFNLTINTTDNMNSDARLMYNGTYKTTTKTSFANYDFYQASFIIPDPTATTANITYTWHYNLTSNIGGSNETNNITNIISAQQILLTNCVSPAVSTTTTLNITLRDEENSSLVNGTLSGIFRIGLAGESTKKNISLTYTADNNHLFCIFPTTQTYITDYTLTYNADGYDQRTLSRNTQILRNVSTNLDLFLLKTAKSILATFITLNAQETSLSDVLITMKRTISGVLTTLQIETTDDAGTATFNVNPDITYTFVFEKTGFTSLTKSIRITQTAAQPITVILGGTSTGNLNSTSSGATYTITPKEEELNNNTQYPFNFNMTSNFWVITNCTFTLKNGSGNILSSTIGTFNKTNCNSIINFNTDNHSLIIAEGTWSNGTTNTLYSKRWNVRDTTKGTFNLKTLLDDIKSLNASGFNDFTRMFMAFLFIMGITIFASRTLNIAQPEALLLLVTILVWFFSYTNWFNAGILGVRPKFGLEKYFFAYLITMISTGFILWRNN